jgi:DNA excision repair protein ERCC-3
LFSATYSVVNLYDFKNDTSVKKVEMKPRNEASLRPYQDECLSKIFSNGRARSGIIVLPCGAGKTLVGVSVASLIQRDTVVLCSGAVAVRQWAEQFQMWTTVEEECVVEFTSHSQGLEKLFRMRSGLILITTYSMIRRGLVSGKQEANPGAVRILGHNWGLLILDEVHMAPADVTWTCMSMTKVKCKVGLTATLVREDAKVSSLDILVGPKLYEAKWMDLADKGYIARVRCLEVSCLMTSEFIQRYLQTSDFRRKANLWTLNPNKFLACLHLLKLHKERQDKVLIFIDDLVCFYSYVDLLETQDFLHGCSITSMHGKTPQKERAEIMKSYKANQGFAVILLSKVGDVAIDLPDACVVIQVSGLYGSRMQETQRLGRILRAKANCQGPFNASFYTLVSKDTSDMHFAFKRQAYLVAQGYSYTAVCFPSPHEEKVSPCSLAFLHLRFTCIVLQRCGAMMRASALSWLKRWKIIKMRRRNTRKNSRG